MGKGGGGGGTTTSTQTTKSEPWSGQQPYLNQLFSEAQKNYNAGGPQYYPGQTLADVSPYTNQAIGQLANRAQNGSPLQTAGQNQALATINGDYLNSNPYLDQTFNRAAQNVEARMKSQWGGNDITPGSGAERAALGQSLSDLATNIYGQNYQTERGRQATATALYPQLAQADYTDISQLSQAGDLQRNLAQQSINDQIQKYNYEQNLPYSNLTNYGNLISGNYGQSGTTTQTTPYFNSGLQTPLGGAIGGGLLGYGIGQGQGWNPYASAGGGAVLGGLMGSK